MPPSFALEVASAYLGVPQVLSYQDDCVQAGHYQDDCEFHRSLLRGEGGGGLPLPPEHYRLAGTLARTASASATASLTAYSGGAW